MRNEIENLLLDIVLNYMDEGIAMIDNNGVFIYYNERMSEIEGLRQEEVIGKYILDIYPTFNSENSTMLKALKTGKPILNNIQSYLNKKGKKIFTVATDIPIIENGKIQGVVEFVKDIEKIKILYDSIHSFETQTYPQKEIKDRKDKANYYHFHDFKTRNKELIQLIKKVQKLSTTDSNVLIYGETGTGKEILAQSIHNNSGRRDKPFIAQNCAAIPETLLESILFGTIKGSFTGAIDRHGLFEQADGGTLLLDELNSMPIHLQAKLLRVIQEGYVRRVGSHIDKKVDVKVIATVNVEPTLLIESKKLREDLFYRLSVISVYIPPLRERKEDILFLSHDFIHDENLSRNKSVKLSMEVKEIFQRYGWSGNVRELRNVIESAMNLVEDGKEIKIEHLPCYLLEKLKKMDIIKENNDLCFSYSDRIHAFEKSLIINALKESQGNVSAASKRLGIKRQTLQHKIKKLMIDCNWKS